MNQRTDVSSSGPTVAVPDGLGLDGVGAGLRVVVADTEVNGVVEVGEAVRGALELPDGTAEEAGPAVADDGIGFAVVVVASDAPWEALVQPASMAINPPASNVEPNRVGDTTRW